MTDLVTGSASSHRARALDRTIRRLSRLLDGGRRLSARYTWWRLAIFVTGAVVTVTLFQRQWYQTGNAILVLFVGVFLVVARYHNRLEERLHRLRRWQTIKTVHVARIARDWPGIPLRPLDTTEDDLNAHPYARDLDLAGPRSLLHLVDTTTSLNGRERLASWLLDQPPSPPIWHDREAVIRELSPLSLFRDRLALEASLVGDKELDGRRLRTALATPVTIPFLMPLLTLQGLLAATTLVLATAAALGILPNYWMLSFGVYAAVYLLHSGHIEPIFGRALSLHGELDKLRALFAYLERRSYAPTPAVGRLCAPLVSGPTRPSLMLRRLGRIASALSIRAHPLIHLGVNAVGPWDLWFTHRLARERTRVFEHVDAWLDVLSELEAAAALATFAHLHPEYCWPAILDASAGGHRNGQHATLSGKAIGHPLIQAEHRVTNGVELTGAGRILLITGSNMSGKSTFLRTVGINLCLAQAGAPVCAQAFSWTWMRMACCIRIDDSLAAGLSYFYAEVKRLKRLLDAAQAWGQPPVLFLIDEIFKGTNNRERLAGSRAYIKALAGSNGLGLVTTHDLELAELDRTIPSLSNMHFQETVHDHLLRFDYRLRPGPCPTTNALRIMALEGLPVDERGSGAPVRHQPGGVGE